MFMMSFIFVMACGLFKWKRICAGFFYPFVYKCITIGSRSSYQESRVWDSISWFNHATFFPCTQPGPAFQTSYVVIFVCVQWVKVRGGWSFCWYWWNCKPSLFKLSFDNKKNSLLQEHYKLFMPISIETHYLTLFGLLFSTCCGIRIK